ncbi:hypothetical protein BP6252_12430 [Coleophoma cylindrospora]|uniref:Voltage-gated hydrogen channel 1 n=1 Tax=Coleophoma cylindrospora TaxID=1849047 RepID=A0A3D8QH30_9HELO|nr:hypothetical protein BP6252_12430 [Coleophoma cylindrospora]
MSSNDETSTLLPTTSTHAPETRHARHIRVYHYIQHKAQAFLSSRAQHYLVLGLVSCDVLSIFADIIISLSLCQGDLSGAGWDDARDVLGIAGLIFSSMFLAELIVNIWAFGWRYFTSYFHCFDATVILAGFVVDVLLHGVLEEIASLVILLRLWRVFKIVEEFSVGAEEQMDGLTLRIEKLEAENEKLRKEVEAKKATAGDEDL